FVSPGGRGDFRSITEALRSAEPGARIVVRPGVYREQLVVDRPVELVGEGDLNDVMLLAPSGPCLVVAGGDVSLGGLTLRSRSGDDLTATLNVSAGRLVLE